MIKIYLRDLFDYLTGKEPDALENSKAKALHDLLVKSGYQATHKYPDREEL